MRWMREREALIAQTLAFVRSVTGTRDDAGKPLARLPPEQQQPDPAAIETAKVEATPVQSGAAVEPPNGPSEPHLPIVSSGFKAELETRIAGFRAHQERFNRERAEYFSATLAKLRAAIDEAPPRRPGK